MSTNMMIALFTALTMVGVTIFGMCGVCLAYEFKAGIKKAHIPTSMIAASLGSMGFTVATFSLYILDNIN
jgi:hypothetical protein